MKHIIEAERINLTYKISQGLSLKKYFTRSKQNMNVSKVHAVKDLSFILDSGENLGIVGSNGSGKSTLMRMISQTYTPDTGTLRINADSIALLALGAGFMPDLTGRDNLYLNALLLGIKKEDLDNGLAEEMIVFSEIGEFIDYPMNTYSSGMVSRLMFSIAVCISPDILLIDEVLSVGDAHFVDKSRKKVKELIESDRSVVLISHDSRAILDYCDKVMWMEKGEQKMYGEPKEVLNEYLSFIGAPKV
ncbi:MAG: ABC transporter ATP-binding protein [Brevinema sp.]